MKGMTFKEMLRIRVFRIFVNFGTLNNKALLTEIGFELPAHSHSDSALYPFVTEEGCQSVSY